jgi:hypothetical protein
MISPPARSGEPGKSLVKNSEAREAASVSLLLTSWCLPDFCAVRDPFGRCASTFFPCAEAGVPSRCSRAAVDFARVDEISPSASIGFGALRAGQLPDRAVTCTEGRAAGMPLICRCAPLPRAVDGSEDHIQSAVEDRSANGHVRVPLFEVHACVRAHLCARSPGPASVEACGPRRRCADDQHASRQPSPAGALLQIRERAIRGWN